MDKITLSGVPQMSDNCAALLIERLDKSSSYLEWGSGNSTILAIKRGNLNNIVSVEHHKGYFLAVLDEISNTLDDSAVTCSFTGYERTNQLKNSQHEDEGLLFNFISEVKSLGLKKIYFSWKLLIAKIVMFQFRKNKKPWNLMERSKIDGISLSTLRSKILASPYQNLEVKIETKELTIRYILSCPENSSITSDGRLNEFHNYVNFADSGSMQFDTILVDGRARASCLDKILDDTLAKSSGVVFCHDAWRTSYLRSLLNFPTQNWIYGSNKDLNGNSFAVSSEAPLGSLGVKDELCICDFLR